MRKTKIICTLGPKVQDEEKIRELILNGMDIARFNFSHMTQAEHIKMFNTVKKVCHQLNLNIATMLDTKGPEIRLGNVRNSKVSIKDGAKFILTTEDLLGDENIVSLSYKNIIKDLKPNMHIFIDDGLIELNLKEVKEKQLICKVIHGGFISDKKGVNIPEANISMPFIDEQNKSDILLGIKLNFDFIAASFTRTKADILELKNLLDEYKSNIKIIAKIENREGINNIESILEIADGVMVARGDMGIELPFEELPMMQKKIIYLAKTVGKPAIVATQMLESMLGSLRPSRAESSDIANAVYDGASAVMLSAETAAGNYPVEALHVMDLIVSRADFDLENLGKIRLCEKQKQYDKITAIVHAAVVMAEDLNVIAILILSETSIMTEAIFKLCPKIQIIACTTNLKICSQLNILRGVIPFFIETSDNKEINSIILKVLSRLKTKLCLKNNDKIVVIGSSDICDKEDFFVRPYTVTINEFQ